MHKIRKLVVANWKMNKTYEEAIDYAANLGKLEPFANGLEVVVCPPFPYINLFVGLNGVSVGAQNVSSSGLEGPYTGEVSAKILKSLGTKYIIIGHSERRKYCNESDSEVKAKATIALESALIPIICIGEDSNTKARGATLEFLKSQIEGSLAYTEKEIVIAYEPIWAIGSGISINLNELNDLAGALRYEIGKLAKNYRLVYGGSLSSKNASEFSECNEIDGFLVGGASLNLDEFIKLIKAYA